VYGFHLMTPIGWGWAGFAWGYALICALLTDPIKVLAYRLIDPVKSAAVPKKPVSITRKAAPASS
jgi:H+-transporting ATPase